MNAKLNQLDKTKAKVQVELGKVYALYREMFNCVYYTMYTLYCTYIPQLTVSYKHCKLYTILMNCQSNRTIPVHCIL